MRISDWSSDVCSSDLSKIFWGGLRVDWIRADPQTVAALGRLRTTMDMASPVVEQLAVAHLIDGDEGLGPRAAMLRGRGDHPLALLERHLPHWQIGRAHV